MRSNAPARTCGARRYAPTHVRFAAAAARSRRAAVVAAFKADPGKELHTKVAIIGGGPAAHTAAIYAARAELEPIVFEGWMAGGLAPGGQLTTTTFVENFPGFVEPIMGIDLTDKFREHSVRYGTRVLTETVTTVDFSAAAAAAAASAAEAHGGASPSSSADGGHHHPQPVHPREPFKLWTPERLITADAVIIATGASARRLRFPGSGDESDGGFWNRGISACAICDGASPILRNKPVAVVGGGDSAMEEALFLTRYAARVYIVHRFDYLEASKAMARRALANPKIEVLWRTEIREAHGNEQGNLGSITVERAGAGGAPPSLQRLDVNGLFFAIGHKPATEFLKGKLALDDYGFIVTQPGTTMTSVPGVFAAGDVMDKKYRQAIVAAGTGCMAALEAERYLQAVEAGASSSSAAAAVAAAVGSAHSDPPQQWGSPAATAAAAAAAAAQ